MGLAAGWGWPDEPSLRGLCLATWLIHSPNSSEKRRPRLGRSRTETSKTRSLLASIRGRSAGMSAHWDHVARDPGRSPRATASVRGRVSRLPPNRAPRACILHTCSPSQRHVRLVYDSVGRAAASPWRAFSA